MRIRGVTLESKGGTKAYKGINGDYQRSQEVSSGRAVYVKVKIFYIYFTVYVQVNVRNITYIQIYISTSARKRL